MLCSSLNSTYLQCIAGSRGRPGTGKIAFIVDNGETLSEEYFQYSDDPQMFSVINSEIIRR